MKILMANNGKTKIPYVFFHINDVSRGCHAWDVHFLEATKSLEPADVALLIMDEKVHI
jgi:hypothetical protein